MKAIKTKDTPIAILLLVVICGLAWVLIPPNSMDLEQEAIHQIRNSDSIRVNRNHNYDGYRGEFTDVYGRWYAFEVTQEIGGLFTEIDTVYSCVIKPRHKAPEVVIEGRRYQKEFYSYVERTYKWYNR